MNDYVNRLYPHVSTAFGYYSPMYHTFGYYPPSYAAFGNETIIGYPPMPRPVTAMGAGTTAPSQPSTLATLESKVAAMSTTEKVAYASLGVAAVVGLVWLLK